MLSSTTTNARLGGRMVKDATTPPVAEQGERPLRHAIGSNASPDLPIPLTPLVGRLREIGAVCALLADPAVRLVTLTGPGGVGKTRLALAVAADVEASFADGVGFVPLAQVRDPDLVPARIVQALGFRTIGNQTPSDTLRAALRERDQLLLIDNFEQVLPAAPFVGELLAHCPRLTVLITSRERLRLSGESAFPVPPLGLPNPDRPLTTAAALETEAVRLFAERGRAAIREFAVTEQNVSDLAAICRQVDGLPLAIELAAARLPVLPPAALLLRLERRLPLLTGGAHDHPARQRTLRDAIAWSHDLLSEPEQAVFRRLAVFNGGCSLTAAEVVCVADGDPWVVSQRAPGLDVLEGIASLIDKSLLRRVDPGDSEPRYAMLETVREYASERLIASDEEGGARDRHAAWCRSLAETAAPWLNSSEQAAWFARLDVELGNLRTALTWLIACGKGDIALRLTLALSGYWAARANYAETRRWLEAALDGSPDAPASARAAALHEIVIQAGLQGDHPAAVARAEEALALARTINDAPALGGAFYDLGLAREWGRDWEKAATYFARAVPLMRQGSEPHILAVALADLGSTLLWQGDVAGAAAAIDESLALYRRIGHTWGSAMATCARAHVALAQGDLALAARLFHASGATAQEIDEERLLLGTISGLAGVAVSRGRPEQAARLLGAVAAAQEAASIPRVMHALHADRIVAATRTRLGEPAVAAAWEAGRTLSLAQVVIEANEVADEAHSRVAGEPTAPAPRLGLTPREREVLRLLSQRLTDKEIAEALFVGPRTVQTHVSNVLAKLGVASRREAAAAAERLGLT